MEILVLYYIENIICLGLKYQEIYILFDVLIVKKVLLNPCGPDLLFGPEVEHLCANMHTMSHIYVYIYNYMYYLILKLNLN